MLNEDLIQAEMRRTEADLEDKIGELKALFEASLATPRRVIQRVERSVFWMRGHTVLVICTAVGLGLLFGLLRVQRVLIRR